MLGHISVALDWTSLGLSPVVFEFHGFALRWYSLAYIGGILGGWWLLGRMLDRPGAPMTRGQADSFITWATLGIILGGRIGYVLFYDFARFAGDPWAIVRLWEGGMAFHGGLLGAALAMVGFARVHRLEWLRIWDYVACVEPIGQLLGRCANFVNAELWGRVTGSSWGIVFPGAGPLPRHPSQLYEAGGEGLLLLALMSWLFWRTPARHYPGFLTGAFVGGFGLIRFGIEFFREPDAQLGYLALGLTMGQWLCAPMIVLGFWLMLSSRTRAARGTPLRA